MSLLFVPQSLDFHPHKPHRLPCKNLDALGRITDKDQLNHGFLLSNRAWQGIDGPFSHLISKTIQQLANKSHDNKPVRVLDLGAGAKAKAANELQVNKKLGKRVFATALDVAYAVQDNEASQVCADMQQIPLADDSIDLIYSRQSFCYMADKGTKQPIQNTISEVERVLKPGGVFFVDKHVHDYLDLDVDLEYLHGHSPYFGKLLSFVLKQTPEWDYDNQFYMMIKKGGSGAVKAFLQKQDSVHPIIRNQE